MHNFIKNLRIGYYIVLYGILRHKGKAGLAAIIATIVVLAVVQFGAIMQSLHQPVFTEGLVGQYQKNNLPPVVENLISLGLTKVNEDGSATASAAKTWDVSEDGKVYTFHLRTDLRWHDGTPFQATDLGFLFEGIETKAIAPDTVQFHLKNPYAPFPTLLARPLLKGTKLLGLGQYKVNKIDEAGGLLSSIELVPAQKKPTSEENPKIIFRFYPSVSDVVTAYKLGELKAAVGFIKPEELASWRNITSYKKVFYTSYIAVLFNTRQESGNILADKTVRQALNYAIPKNTNLGDEAISPIPPTSWAFNPEVKKYVYDLNVARDLLTRKEGTASGSIVLTTTQPYKDYAEAITAEWRKLGLSVSVQVTNDISNTFQAALVRQQIPKDPDQYALWHSLQKDTNLTGYKAARIDKLLEDARASQDMDVRKRLYFDFQRYLVEDSPAVFLYFPNETLLLHKRFDKPFYREINGF